MIKPNWDIFKAKFNDNPQINFEWFCYLLFCREFHKDTGIFRYKNQSAIETNPIQKGSEIIGWQAKFYDTPLTQHKAEFINSLDTVKKNYPNLTKVIFYTNQEWGQYKGKVPQGKKDVEKKSKELNINVEWRTASYFESTFVSIDNEIIAKHFFSLYKSLFDLIVNQQKHSENILNEIQTAVSFNSQNIKIDRSNSLDKIRFSSEKILILSGMGGVGKTALIKDFYEEIEDKMPFYVLKATEFELRNINDLFSGFSMQDFLDSHKGEDDKIVVIDSAEKLLDLKNTDPFKEFLSVLVKESWKVVFTTRENYLEDLNYQFFEIYRVAPLNINIQNIDLKELNVLSNKFCFSLPNDERLTDLIRNPFYLNEYLRFYKKGEQINYTDFKNKLWNRIVLKTKPARERCFLNVAFQRATSGQFFVNPDCESEILDNELRKDGILGYESPRGYFITHDIYEEWALEKIIEAEFGKKTDSKAFFLNIGNSLPLRRAFREWMSEKLLLQNKEIKEFIEKTIKNREVESFWEDEILVSVLLSDYSEPFFDIFKEQLLADNQETLRKMTFLLRIACKEVDDEYFRQLGLKDLNTFTLEYVLTKPKGQGWQSLIKFVFDNLDKIGIQNTHYVLPIVYDWSSKIKKGEATRYSGLIALRYYQWLLKDDVYISEEDTKNNIVKTIIYSSYENKAELEEIFKEIIKNKWKYHRDPYYDLSKYILTKYEGSIVAHIFPKYVLQIADLFWSFTPKNNRYYSSSGIGMEEHFNMEEKHLDYFPPSPYQTPIYWLLQASLQETIDFILYFTNKTVDYFAKSEFAKYEVEEVEVSIGERESIKQYNSRNGRLWNMYRGSSAPAPEVLQSMHMALEKFFIDNGKGAESKSLESWLIYLLKKSKSTSISAVVASIVLAYPDKTFNVAKILFQTKEFFFYDTGRLVLDQTHKSSLLSLRANFGINSKYEMYENERLEACDDKHRKWNLESLFLRYQCFRDEKMSEQEAESRQKVLWGILDNYYKELPLEKDQTEFDQTWRLYLARMDRRKMDPITRKTDEGIEIHWNPELDPILKEKREDTQKELSKKMKYTALNVWSHYKMENNEQCKQYKQYDNNPKHALKETKELILKLRSLNKPKRTQVEQEEDYSFYILNYAIPGEVCSVLIRDYIESLTKKEVDFCKNVVLEVAASSFRPNYQYQISDGVSSSISVLPVLLGKFPKDKKTIKTILLITLFDSHTIGMSEHFSHYSIRAIISSLWKISFDDANSILFGYLLLKPKYEQIRKRLWIENNKNGVYELSEPEVIEKFLKEERKELKRVVNNKLYLDDLKNMDFTDLPCLRTGFQLIPLKTDNNDHEKLVQNIISVFAAELLSNNKDDKIDYSVKYEFLKKMAYFVLSMQKENIQKYLEPFIDKFNNSETIADLLVEFVSAEDRLNTYDNFWEVWYLFKSKIVDMCKKKDNNWYTDKIIKSYLFAQVAWKETTTSWHTLKDSDKRFFREMAREIGHCPSTFYSISKLLNDIGTSYIDDGVLWISDILNENKHLQTSKLEVNTVYYTENLIRKFIYNSRSKIRETKELKENVIVILNFLIAKGSAIGYILRENIL